MVIAKFTAICCSTEQSLPRSLDIFKSWLVSLWAWPPCKFFYHWSVETCPESQPLPERWGLQEEIGSAWTILWNKTSQPNVSACDSFHMTSNSEIYFPFSFSKPIYYFLLQKINITSSFKHWSLKFTRLSCFILKRGKIHQRRADLCNRRAIGTFTGSDYSGLSE